jgi:hypothetical protein
MSRSGSPGVTRITGLTSVGAEIMFIALLALLIGVAGMVAVALLERRPPASRGYRHS